MRVDTQKLFEEFLDIIDDFYGLPEGPESEDLNFRIQIAIAACEIKESKPRLRGLAKVLAKRPRKRKRNGHTKK